MSLPGGASSSSSTGDLVGVGLDGTSSSTTSTMDPLGVGVAALAGVELIGAPVIPTNFTAASVNCTGAKALAKLFAKSSAKSPP